MIKKIFISAYKKFFVRKRFYKLHRYLLNIALWGTGFFNGENFYLSGEDYVLKLLKRYYSTLVDNITMLDVGASIGEYATILRNFFPQAVIFAFEPHPVNFKKLQEISKNASIIPINCAVSLGESEITLYSHSENNVSCGSLYQIKHQSNSKTQVKVISLDRFFDDYRVNHVQFIKIDTEGNELNIVKGAKQLIEDGKIDFIQFEFNSMNVLSRSFFDDFSKLLPQYHLYRMLPDGLIRVIEEPVYVQEQFIFQNIFAIRSDIEESVRRLM